MSIALFIIFLFMNFFILLIMKFVYTSNYSYTEGMLLGVHIPKEHSEDETVLNIVAAARRKMNRIIWINLILGTALCFVVFWEIIIFVLAYTIWMIAFCFWITYANNSAHRKMYAIKMANDWVVPEQRRKRYIDTNVSTQIGKSEISFNYHGIIILVELICLLPFAIGKKCGHINHNDNNGTLLRPDITYIYDIPHICKPPRENCVQLGYPAQPDRQQNHEDIQRPCNVDSFGNKCCRMGIYRY